MPPKEGAHFETDHFPLTLKGAEAGAFFAALWTSVFFLALRASNTPTGGGKPPKGR